MTHANLDVPQGQLQQWAPAYYQQAEGFALATSLFSLHLTVSGKKHQTYRQRSTKQYSSTFGDHGGTSYALLATMKSKSHAELLHTHHINSAGKNGTFTQGHVRGLQSLNAFSSFFNILSFCNLYSLGEHSRAAQGDMIIVFVFCTCYAISTLLNYICGP